MTWKLKILSIKHLTLEKKISVYFSLLKQNSLGKFVEHFKGSQELTAQTINSGSVVKPIAQREQFIKDFVKNIIKPLINTFESFDGLESLEGHEEII